MPRSKVAGMEQDIERILISSRDIDLRLNELAKAILADHESSGGDRPTELTFVPILTGAMIFTSDLIRKLPIKLEIRVMSISSYPGAATSSRGASVEAALTRIPDSLEGLHVVLIDDILDTGTTLQKAAEILQAKNPASLKTCVLLRKERGTPPVIEADYAAFSVPDEFVVGYGLDFNDHYRNLPEIAVLKPEVFEHVL